MKTRSSTKAKVENQAPSKNKNEEPKPETKLTRKRSISKLKEESKKGKEEEETTKEVLQCGICFEDVKIRGKLNACEHPFCFECISQWSKTANTCPFCKGRFTSLDKIDSDEPKKKAKKIKVKHADQHYEWEGPQSYLEFDHPLLNQFSAQISQMVADAMSSRVHLNDMLNNNYSFSDEDDDDEFGSDDSDDLLDEDDEDDFGFFDPNGSVLPGLALIHNLFQVGFMRNRPGEQFQNTSESPIDLTQEDAPPEEENNNTMPPLLVDSDSDSD